MENSIETGHLYYFRRIAREFKDPENPDAPEIAQDWGEMGFDRAEAQTWKDAGFCPTGAQAWKDLGFDPEKAKVWKDKVGYNSAYEASQLEASGYSVDDLEGLSHQDIMSLFNEQEPEN